LSPQLAAAAATTIEMTARRVFMGDLGSMLAPPAARPPPCENLLHRRAAVVSRACSVGVVRKIAAPLRRLWIGDLDST
jgi:hypothetical protein